MFKKLAKKIRSDDGDSTLISTVIILPFFIMLFFTVIDMSFWFNNRSMMTSVARDGARTVAIMGGTESPLAADYGLRDEYDNPVSVEDNIEKTLLNTPGLVGVDTEAYEVKCSPDIAMGGVGETTRCEITWKYNGIGFSAFSVLASLEEYAFEDSALSKNKTVGTAESEVSFG